MNRLGNLQHVPAQLSARSREMHLSGFAGHQVRNPSDKHLYQEATVTNPEDTSSAENNVPPTAPYSAEPKYCTFHSFARSHTLPRYQPHAPGQCMQGDSPASKSKILATNTSTNGLRSRTLNLNLLHQKTPPRLLRMVPYRSTARFTSFARSHTLLRNQPHAPGQSIQ